MSKTVKCEFCGKLYNWRYVSSHVNRSHPEIARAVNPSKADQKAVEKILTLWEQLSPKAREQVLNSLAPSLKTNSCIT